MKKLSAILRRFAKKYDVTVMDRGLLNKATIVVGKDDRHVTVYNTDTDTVIATNVLVTDKEFPVSIIAVRRRRGRRLLESNDIILLKPVDVLYIK